MAGRDFEDLDVYRLAREFRKAVYGLTRSLPADERLVLVRQMRRAAISVTNNIAEGHGRSSRRDYAGFVAVAKGSLLEAETQLLIAVRLKYIDEARAQQALSLIGELERMLAVLRSKLISGMPGHRDLQP